MHPIVLLLSSLAVASATPVPMIDAATETDPLNVHFDFPPMPNLSVAARKDFSNILLNQSPTIAQMEGEIKAWAEKNGVGEQVNVARDVRKKQELRENVTRALGELPPYIAKVNAIEDNKSLTLNQIYEQTQALLESITTPFLRRLLNAVSHPDSNAADITVAATGADADPLNVHFDFPPMPNLSEQARKDFSSILLNQSLTIAQMEGEIRSWAEKNGVVDQVNVGMTRDEQKRNDLRANVTRAVGELPSYIAKVNSVEDNKSLTINQIDEQTQTLFESIQTPYVRRLLEVVSRPEYSE